MSTLNELLQQRQALDEQINEVRKKEMNEALSQVKALVKQFDLKPQDVFPTSKHSNAGKKISPKYRNPATGETWTGRGKAPLWIQGQNKDQFLISA